MAHRFILLAGVLVNAALVTASPAEQIFGRHIGDKCRASEGSGTCQNTSNCKGISYPQDLCPNDPNDVQCCVEIKCNVSGAGSGYCRSKANNGCPNGQFHAGTSAPWPCPGDDDIQCCIPSSSSGGGGGTSPPPPSGSSVGAKVLAQAETAAGLPYAWGGGSCSGPTHDQPPYEYGDIGFDCSGLVCWALCKVTGRDLFKEGLRNTHSMYCARESTLKYKKYPFSERMPGDAVFFGGACSCDDSESIHHVGLMVDSGDTIFNAPDDQINKIEKASISSFGEKPCPSVIRFTR